MTDLQKAFERFKDISDRYTALFGYYDGNQPLRYSTQRLRDAFQQLDVRFRENWCAVVIDAVLDRMELYGWSTGDEKVTQVLTDVWEESGLALESNEVHESALVCGESFLIGWQDDGQPLEFYYNDPRQAAVFYDPDHPRVKSFAAKWWDSDDGCRMVLYYPDRLEHYLAAGRTMAAIDAGTGVTAFRMEEETPNPYGMIPVFHFRNSLRKKSNRTLYDELKSGKVVLTHKSELDNVTELQDSVNKLFCDMMVTAEFDAFPARYVISSTEISPLKNAPNQIWDLPAGIGEGQGTQVGTLEAANLANYSGQIDHIVNAVAAITRTPRHYFENQGANVSGEALVTMEAPLVKKVNQKRELFGSVWQEVALFALQVMGMTAKRKDIQPQWGGAESDQPLTEAQIIKTNRDAGLPLKTALRLNGYTDAEIEIVEQEIAEEKQSQDLSALYLQTARDESAQKDEI